MATAREITNNISGDGGSGGGAETDTTADAAMAMMNLKVGKEDDQELNKMSWYIQKGGKIPSSKGTITEVNNDGKMVKLESILDVREKETTITVDVGGDDESNFKMTVITRINKETGYPTITVHLNEGENEMNYIATEKDTGKIVEADNNGKIAITKTMKIKVINPIPLSDDEEEESLPTYEIAPPEDNLAATKEGVVRLVQEKIYELEEKEEKEKETNNKEAQKKNEEVERKFKLRKQQCMKLIVSVHDMDNEDAAASVLDGLGKESLKWKKQDNTGKNDPPETNNHKRIRTELGDVGNTNNRTTSTTAKTVVSSNHNQHQTISNRQRSEHPNQQLQNFEMNKHQQSRYQPTQSTYYGNPQQRNQPQQYLMPQQQQQQTNYPRQSIQDNVVQTDLVGRIIPSKQPYGKDWKYVELPGFAGTVFCKDIYIDNKDRIYSLLNNNSNNPIDVRVSAMTLADARDKKGGGERPAIRKMTILS